MEQLTEEQIEEYKEAFTLYDTNENGTIRTKDMATVMRSLGICPSEADVEQLLKDYDTGDGLISFGDFLEIMKKKEKDMDSDEELREAFRTFDQDGKGLINVNELRHVLLNLGEKLTEDEVDEMFKAADPNSEGYLDYEAFATQMRSGR